MFVKKFVISTIIYKCIESCTSYKNASVKSNVKEVVNPVNQSCKPKIDIFIHIKAVCISNIYKVNIDLKKLKSKNLNSIYICYYCRDIKAVLVKYK